MSDSDSNSSAEVAPDLLEILRCPVAHEPLVPRAGELWCAESKKAYPIENGIPVLLVEEARDLTDEELASL